MAPNYVGINLPRLDAPEKVTGSALYVDDLAKEGCLYGVTVRSSIPRGTIKQIRFKEHVAWDEFCIVTAKDIPGVNMVALIDDDQPLLASDRVNHIEEPVVLLAHPDKKQAEAARDAVEIICEAETPIIDVEEALRGRDKIWRNDNVFKKLIIDKGDVDQVWRDAHKIVEGEYRTGHQEHLYIEPNGVLATFDKELGLTIYGSMQCPYYIHKALKGIFALDDEKVRVVQTATGGGFGGKEEYPNMIAGHAALLSMKSGRPVKMVYKRDEDMRATTKRHPSIVRIKSAFDKDARLQALDIEIIVDGGAYSTLSMVVISRAALHASGSYLCPNIRITGYAVATNTPPNGAFRGFGAPQSIFAIERHLDEAAQELDINAHTLRERNFIKRNDIMATGQVVRDNIDMSVLMRQAFEKSDFFAKKKEFAEYNRQGRIRRGIGFASFLHGAGFTGSGEKRLASVVGLELASNGRVRILTSSTEIGQGTRTILPQIVAQALGIDIELVEMASPDTSLVPDSGPTVASRTCMIVGKLLYDTAQKLKRHMEQFGSSPTRITTQYQQPEEIVWDEVAYRGDAYPCFAKAVYVAEVSVDTMTYATKVERVIAVQDVGKVVHPVLASGQIEGGVVQGIGYALYENVVMKDGRMVNDRMTNYIIPTSLDVPDIQVFFEETQSPYGPYGAVGIGELPLDGAAPAVVSAIENAVGISMRQLPVTPELLRAAMESRHVV